MPRQIFNICKDEEHTIPLGNLCQSCISSKNCFPEVQVVPVDFGHC